MEQSVVNMKRLRVISIQDERHINDEDNHQNKIQKEIVIQNHSLVSVVCLDNKKNVDISDINNNTDLKHDNNENDDIENQENKSSLSRNIPSSMNTITLTMNKKNKFKKTETQKILLSLLNGTNATPSIKTTNINTGNNVETNGMIESFCKENHKRNITNDTNLKFIISPPESHQCLLCKRCFSEKSIISTGNCNHIYCFKCIQQIFENNIKQGNINISNFKCPIVLCNELFSFKIVYQVISPAYLAYITGRKYFLKSSFDEVKDLKNIRQDKGDAVLKFYNQNNVIDFSTNRNFYSFTKFKQKICPYCHCIDLFNKKSSVFFVCMYCLKSFCKNCLFEYNDTYLMQNNIEHCRVCFRNGNYNPKKTCRNKIVQILLQFLYVISAYFISHVGVFKYIDSCFYNKKKWKKLKIFMRTLSLLCSILIYILLLPFLLMIIPYFPYAMII